jgi:hypothetical protein
MTRKNNLKQATIVDKKLEAPLKKSRSGDLPKAALKRLSNNPAAYEKFGKKTGVKKGAPAVAHLETRQPPIRKAVSPAQKNISGAGEKLIMIYQWGSPGKTVDTGITLWTPPSGIGEDLPTQVEILQALQIIATADRARGSALWGLLPPDFYERTGMKPDQFRARIEAEPGHDVYYCSANPELEAIYHNAWRPPVITHPGFLDLSRKFLQAAGLGATPLDSVMHSALYATGHLMVASSNFWAAYLGFVDKVIAQARVNLDEPSALAIFGEKSQGGRMSNISLILARLLGLFLMVKDSQWKAMKIALPVQESTLNPHLRSLREMKDLALEQKSRWLVGAWTNYRGLYLAHVMGRAWVMEHLKNINPSVLHIGMPTAKVEYGYPGSDMSASVPTNPA